MGELGSFYYRSNVTTWPLTPESSTLRNYAALSGVSSSGRGGTAGNPPADPLGGVAQFLFFSLDGGSSDQTFIIKRLTFQVLA